MIQHKQDDNRQKRLMYQRKLAILDADLRKKKKEEQMIDMEVRRVRQKLRKLESEMQVHEKDHKKIANEVRQLEMEHRTWKKRLDRLS
jgi:FtsZ-binding cell division protein ZapB